MKKISFYLMMLFVAGLLTGCKEEVTTGPESLQECRTKGIYEATIVEVPLKADAVARSMQIGVNTIRDIYKAECADNPKQYNDNQLFTTLVNKLRQSKPSKESKQQQQRNKNSIEAPEHRFHPSFVAIESILTIVKSNPGIGGDINPFVQITDKGHFDKEATYWYAEIENVKKCLAGM